MKWKRKRSLPLPSLALFGLTIVLFVAAMQINAAEIVSGMLILLAVASSFLGIIIVAFRQGNVVDAEMAANLPVSNTINLCMISNDLGVTGNAHFFPVFKDNSVHIMQFNSVSPYVSDKKINNFPFHAFGEKKGIVMIPSGYHLLRMLEDTYDLHLPTNESDLFETIKVIGEDIFEIADSITAIGSGEHIKVELKNYRFFTGCIAAQEESPECCTIAPCPVCSLIPMMLARGAQNTVTINSVTTELKNKSITLNLSYGE